MAKKDSVKTMQINTFTGGLVTDTNPLLTPNNVLTDCLNGTIITHNGNEFTLQNDVGNIKTGCILEGHKPIAIKELDGIAYIVSKCDSDPNHDGKSTIRIGTYPGVENAVANVDPNVVEQSKLGVITIDDSITIDELKKWLNSFDTSFTLPQDHKAFVPVDNMPDFIGVDYVWNNINKQALHTEDIQADNYIISDNNINKIYIKTSILAFKNMHADSNLVYADGQIIGYITLNGSVDKLLHQSKCWWKLYINDKCIDEGKKNYFNQNDYDLSARIFLDHYLNSEEIDIRIELGLEYTKNNESIDIIYNDSFIYMNIDPESLIHTYASAFNNLYYYNVGDTGVDITFDATCFLNDYENLTLSVSDFKIEENQIKLTEEKELTISSNGTIHTATIELSDWFVANEIYLVNVKYNKEIIGQRLLIVNKAFNNFLDSAKDTLDFGKIKGNEWLSKCKFEDVEPDISIKETYTTLVEDSSAVDHRRYKTNIKIDSQESEGQFNSFKTEYIPYISNNVDFKAPSISVGYNFKSTLSNVLPNMSGIFSNVDGIPILEMNSKLMDANNFEITILDKLSLQSNLTNITLNVPNRVYYDSIPTTNVVNTIKLNNNLSNQYYRGTTCELYELSFDRTSKKLLARAMDSDGNDIDGLELGLTMRAEEEYIMGGDWSGDQWSYAYDDYSWSNDAKEKLGFKNVITHNESMSHTFLQNLNKWPLYWIKCKNNNDAVDGELFGIGLLGFTKNENNKKIAVIIRINIDGENRAMHSDDSDIEKKIKTFVEFWNSHSFYTTDVTEYILNRITFDSDNIQLTTEYPTLSQIKATLNVETLNIKGHSVEKVVQYLECPNDNLDVTDSALLYNIQLIMPQDFKYESNSKLIDELKSEMLEFANYVNQVVVFKEDATDDLDEPQFDDNGDICTLDSNKNADWRNLKHILSDDIIPISETLKEDNSIEVEYDDDLRFYHTSSDGNYFSWSLFVSSSMYATYDDLIELNTTSLYKKLGKDEFIKRTNE